MTAIALRAEIAAGGDAREIARKRKLDVTTVWAVARGARYAPKLTVPLTDPEILEIDRAARKAMMPVEQYAALLIRKSLAT